MRAAIVLRQLRDHGLVLRLTVTAAAFELLEIAHRVVEIAAHLLDLRVQRPAFRRQAGEQREEALARAADAIRLHERAVEIAAYVSSEPGPGGEPLYEWIDVREVMWERARTTDPA